MYVYFDHQRKYQRDVEKVVPLFEDAKDLERRGQLQRAYQRYDVACEGFKIDRKDIPMEACKGQERLSAMILRAYRETMEALNQYRATHGSYPDSLDVVKNHISPEFADAVDGFKYVREGDKVGIATGLYGTVSFTLRR